MVKNERGLAMVIVVALAIFILPVLTVLVRRLNNQVVLATREKQVKSARVLSNNILVDYMRQFSEDYYSDHYTRDFLDKMQEYQFDKGSSTTTFTASRANRYVLFQNTGKFGANPANPRLTKRLTGLVRFRSDLTRFAVMAGRDLTIDFPLRVNNGGVWVTGDLVVANGIPTPSGFGPNPVNVRGGLAVTEVPTIAPNTRIDMLFRDRTKAGATLPAPGLLGNDYDFRPGTSGPAAELTDVNLEYYGSRNTFPATPVTNLTGVVGNDDWDLNLGPATAGNSNSYLRIEGVPSTPGLPAGGRVHQINPDFVPNSVIGGGSIIYVEGKDIQIDSTLPANLNQIRGRVTIVCRSVPGAGGIPVGGNVTITDDIQYVGPNSALAVLADGNITFNSLGAGISNMSVVGLYYTRNGDIRLEGDNDDTFTLGGSFVIRRGTLEVDGFVNGGCFLNRDDSLMANYPPGLPERPRLIMWRPQG